MGKREFEGGRFYLEKKSYYGRFFLFGSDFAPACASHCCPRFDLVSVCDEQSAMVLSCGIVTDGNRLWSVLLHSHQKQEMDLRSLIRHLLYHYFNLAIALGDFEFAGFKMGDAIKICIILIPQNPYTEKYL